MKARWKWALLSVIGVAALAAGFAIAWVLWGPFSFASAAAKVKEEAALLNGRDPQRMLAEANRFYWGHNLPLALPLYERAEALFTQAHDDRDALYAKIGAMRSGDAVPFPQLSAFIASQLKTPLVQNDAELRLFCLGVKGDADDEVNVAAAQKDWTQARSLAQQLGEKEWANRATGELGLISFLQGNIKQAAHMMGGALLTAMEQSDTGTEVRYLEIVGNGWNALNRPAEAMFFFNRVIGMADRNHDIGTPFMAYEGKAEALAMEGKMDEAQALMQRTLAEARKEKMLEHEGQDLLILGEFAAESGQTAHARQYLEEAMQSATQAGLPRVAMQSCFDLSKLLQQGGDLKDAENTLNQGLAISRTTGDTYYLPRALDALAELKAQTGQPDQAYALYKQAEGVIDGMLVRYPGEYSESSLLSAMSSTYLGDFKLATSQNSVSAAFDAIEQARGRTVLDNMRDPAVAKAQTPAQREAESQISQIQNELLDTNDPAQRRKLLVNLDAEEETLRWYTEALTPEQRRDASDSISLKAAQAAILPGEAVLEYVLSDPNSYCLAVTHNDAAIARLPAGTKQIAQLMSRYKSEVMAGKFASQDAKALYAALLKPIPESFRLRNLVIVSDGVLNDLPFDALQRPDGQYVIESHVISYAPSATVLCYLRNRHREHQPQMAFLGIGDVPYDMEPQRAQFGVKHTLMAFVARGMYDISGDHLYALPETRQELMLASQALGDPRQTILLLGANATEAQFKAEPLSDFKIIHFAVHGLSTPNFPERDALVLGRDPHSTDDGLLQVREIAQLYLHADLVMLSACDTATGKLEGEEGTIGLVQAFLFAGARTVAASLWPVDDSSTEFLMAHFYAHLAQHQDEAGALRQAKLDYLKQKGSKPPIYWAPFVVVGDASKPINF
jgi:CHAT domain-containing protein